MAEADNEELDLDKKKPAGKKNLILYTVIALLLVGLSVTGTMLILGNGKPAEMKAGEENKSEPLGVAKYVPLKTMVVNFGDKGPVRFLQVDIQVMTREEKVSKAIEEHMPVIRNDILLLLSSQSYETVSTLKGKEQLRNQIREAIQKILKKQAGLDEGVSAVYFTSFVMQ
jgi:flagellar FliL protein